MTSLTKLIQSKIWEYFIVFVIVLNSITLGLETSKFMQENFITFLHLIDTVCLWIFVVELVLRIIVHKHRFFVGKEWGWNWFDFIIVGVSLLSMGGLSILRALRVLRVLRLLSMIPSMRVVSSALLNTLPSMASISILLLIFYYIYGILCVNLFGEAFPQWFGTLGLSFYTLFQIMTLEGWSDGIVRPIMEVYPYAWIVFISYILIVSFVVLNLILGVVVESLSELKEKNKEKKE